MAKIEAKGIEEYLKQLRNLGDKIEGTIKYAVYPAAGMVLNAIKDNTPYNSGDLRNSEALTEFKEENGFVYTKVVFSGYDSKGVPNALKAAVLEHGRSGKNKKPFIRPAVNRVKSAAETEMERMLYTRLNEMMNKGD